MLRKDVSAAHLAQPAHIDTIQHTICIFLPPFLFQKQQQQQQQQGYY